jgi:hypothetical protein
MLVGSIHRVTHVKRNEIFIAPIKKALEKIASNTCSLSEPAFFLKYLSHTKWCSKGRISEMLVVAPRVANVQLPPIGTLQERHDAKRNENFIQPIKKTLGKIVYNTCCISRVSPPSR